MMTRITKLGGALVAAAVMGWTPIASAQIAPLLPATQVRFTLDLPIPIDYVPDRTTFPGFDYYEVQMSPVTPVPVAFPQGGCGAGTQWLGLTNGAVKLCTPVWGYSQTNAPGVYPLNGASTYPSMNFRALKGRPVKVKWVNNATDQHLFCPEPLNPLKPCAIDRSLMGTLGAPVQHAPGVSYGGPMQADNAMVVHLHGGEIPPDSDGFAELWFGNANSSLAYPPFPSAPVQGSIFGATQDIEPLFDTSLVAPGASGFSNAVEVGNLVRPVGNAMIYNYPMVQPAAPIWYHDHALGKTRINVAAGPAGFFIVEDPVKEATLGLPPKGDCSVAGVLKNAANPAAASACFDINVAIQDRSFNIDGTINFPNGLGQAPIGPPPPGVDPVAWNLGLLPGPNPTIHPQWVPEYFGDMAVVNGVIWPKLKVEPRPYRFRLLDGSNARCYVLTLKSPTLLAVPRWTIIGSDQGYLPAPQGAKAITMCPGERYDVVIDFSGVPAGSLVTMANSADAPFPNGVPPRGQSPFAFLAEIMQFQVVAADPTNLPAPARWVPPVALVARDPLPPLGQAVAKTRQMILNEVLDPVTLAPLRVQIDGKRFEDAVTETPARGTTEVWNILNTTVDAHPIHLHLVQFQVVSRQAFDMRSFLAALGPTDPFANPQNYNLNFNLAQFLRGNARGPELGETGWKDTARSFPGEVLTVIAKWDGGWADAPPAPAAPAAPCPAPYVTCNPAAPVFTSTDPDPLSPTYGTPVPVTQQVQVCQAPAAGAPTVTGNPSCACAWDLVNPVCTLPETPIMVSVTVPVPTPFWEPVTAGPYVWHCHIVDHEDNEMMRPTLVIPVGI
ncbi:MAG TPA: multicopper oxidase domain-containing protein [Anaeromyxobacter sp.]|nr:multicopper oxidase domain-containing protein [Anaeromyxobacter sp.]